MIRERIAVFENLIHFYAMIQKQVNNFLEQKRLQFARFYFLNDSQFLEMIMLANSNQDFNCYVNMLFTGAQKLFVTRLLRQEDLEQHSLALKNQESHNHFDEDEVEFESLLE